MISPVGASCVPSRGSTSSSGAARERLGLVARLRDVLPGRYAFGLTGRGPRGGALAKGPYRLRVLAVPPDGPAEAETVNFRIR